MQLLTELIEMLLIIIYTGCPQNEFALQILNSKLSLVTQMLPLITKLKLIKIDTQQ